MARARREAAQNLPPLSLSELSPAHSPARGWLPDGRVTVFVHPWLDESLSKEARYEAALYAIRDECVHTEEQRSMAMTYCAPCLAAVTLDPSVYFGGKIA